MADFCFQSLVSNFQYPNFLGGDWFSVRGDRFDISVLREKRTAIDNSNVCFWTADLTGQRNTF
jgi:hypothetical protein